jgi:hypothetical protein
MNPQAGVALTTGANDALVIVVGSGPCVTVVAAPSMLQLLLADSSAAVIPIASSDAAPRSATIALYRNVSPISVVGEQQR